MKKSKAQQQREKREREANDKKVNELKRAIKGASLFNMKDVPSKAKLEMPTNVRYQMDTTTKIKSNDKIVNKVRIKQELTPEMLVRERAARKELEQKSKRIAPLFNKGAYQYITDDMDPKTIGRK